MKPRTSTKIRILATRTWKYGWTGAFCTPFFRDKCRVPPCKNCPLHGYPLEDWIYPAGCCTLAEGLAKHNTKADRAAMELAMAYEMAGD